MAMRDDADRMCENCGQEPATKLMAMSQSEIRRVKTFGGPAKPRVALCHFCWLEIASGHPPPNRPQNRQ